MTLNLIDQVAWLWKWRHKHEDDPDEIKQIIIRIDQLEAGAAISSTGAYVHLLRETSQSIASGGAAIEWGTLYSVIPQFEFALVAPTTDIIIPKAGYYDVHIERILWGSWDGGGNVWITRTRSGVTETVWPPTDEWADSDGSVFFDTADAIPCQVGDILQVWVDAASGSTETLASATVTVSLDDRHVIEPTSIPTPTPGGLFIYLEDDVFDWEAAGSPDTLSDVWVIAGGGAGGGIVSAPNWKGGGGGAGGVLHLEDYAVTGDVAVVVGLGGVGNQANGEDSSFDGQVATGGGAGGTATTNRNGNNGGSGGGGATAGTISSGVAGLGSQGEDGGDAPVAGNAGGGGGGFSEVGEDGASSTGGDGGDGIDLSAIVGVLFGEAGWFAGGGAGYGATPGSGGQGGGADPSTSAAANTGGGGGGGFSGAPGGNGGSGIVIVKVT